jgi:hypothetical protein
VSSCTAVRVGLIEESCIRVVTQDHVTGPVHNAVCRIGSNMVEKEVNCFFSVATVAYAWQEAMALRATKSLLSTAQA